MAIALRICTVCGREYLYCRCNQNSSVYFSGGTNVTYYQLPPTKNKNMMTLIKKLLSPDDRLLTKYVFDDCGNLDFEKELLQEALLTFPKFKEHLISIVKKHDKEVKRKK